MSGHPRPTAHEPMLSEAATSFPRRPAPLGLLLTSVARLRAIEQIESSIRRRGAPRAQMAFIVLLTGAAGFVSSFLLLHAGMTRMVVRYPLAVTLAYAAFLGCLWVWRRKHRLHARPRDEGKTSILDRVDFDVTGVDFSFGGQPPADAPAFDGFGGGGGFSGGGGGSSWGSGAPAARSAASGTGAKGGGADFGGLDLDDGVVVLIPLAIAVAVVGGIAAYVIYIAPTLFAELLLDTALSAGLYRRLRHHDARSWLSCALRRTVLPAAFAALLLGVAGWWMQGFFPTASSIGRVWEQLDEPQAARGSGR